MSNKNRLKKRQKYSIAFQKEVYERILLCANAAQKVMRLVLV